MKKIKNYISTLRYIRKTKKYTKSIEYTSEEKILCDELNKKLYFNYLLKGLFVKKIRFKFDKVIFKNNQLLIKTYIQTCGFKKVVIIYYNNELIVKVEI